MKKKIFLEAVIIFFSCWLFAQATTPIDLPKVQPLKKQRQVQIRNQDPSDLPRNNIMPLDPSMAEIPGTPHPAPSALPPQIASVELPPLFYYAGLVYSPFDLVIPNKVGLLFGWHRELRHSYEIEYLRGSVGLPGPLEKFGAVTEDRLTFVRRSYLGTSSFNFLYGLNFNRFESHIGSAILNRATGGQSVDLIALETLGGTIGIGNRWVISDRFLLGVDWLTYAQPLIVTRSQSDVLNLTNGSSDAGDLESGFKYVKYFPRLSFLKLQLGFQF